VENTGNLSNLATHFLNFLSYYAFTYHAQDLKGISIKQGKLIDFPTNYLFTILDPFTELPLSTLINKNTKEAEEILEVFSSAFNKIHETGDINSIF